VSTVQGNGVVSFELTGVAIGDDGRPVPNAHVGVNFQPEPGAHFVGVSGRTDGVGAYDIRFTAVPGAYYKGAGATAEVVLVGDGYEAEYRWFRPTTSDAHQTLDLHPRLINQITAGESISVTVTPDDTPCINNLQDIPGLGPDYVCRTVRILVAAAGVLTVEARPAGGSSPPLEVETVPEQDDCCLDGLSNPRTLSVAAGTVVKASIEIPVGSTASQTFTLKTTIRQ
jgi:hypothetical protein